ncbi:MAG: YgaP-like transmembrane domain [Candidatus Tectimicrobiota bacterium]
MADVVRTLSQSDTRHPTPRPRPTDPAVNVGESERGLSLLAGGLLGLYLLKRSLGTLVLVGGAGALLYRGWRGQCALYQALGISSTPQNAQPENPPADTGEEEPSRIVLAQS